MRYNPRLQSERTVFQLGYLMAEKKMVLINKLVLSLLLTTLFNIMQAYAQGGMESDEASKRIKMAQSLPPDAAAFQKYSYNPVSLSSGVSNISIPLLNFAKGELSEAITLEYHTGGIKVNERSTKQGLGWLLNVGGMITRSIQGAQADEHTYGYLNKKGLLPNATDPNLTDADNFGYPNGAFQDFCYDVATNPIRRKRVDLEPDVFTYKFGQKSGMFYFSTTGKIVTDGLDPIKIEAPSDLAWFKITDENGIVYMFELTQNSTVSNSTQQLSGKAYHYDMTPPFKAIASTSNISVTPPEEGLPVDNGWNLTRIIHPNQVDVIYFDYASTSYAVQNKGSQFLEYPYMVYTWVQGLNPPSELDAAIFETVSGVEEVENILTRIRYGNSSIEFNYLRDRQDKYVPLERLVSIVAKDALGNVVQTISLDNNSYFNSTYGRVSYNATDYYETKRLKLNGVIFKGDGSEKPYSYRFKYNEARLPIINATAQDYWGYYNGKDGNLSLIPETKVPRWGVTSYLLDYGHRIIGDADRTVSENDAKAFILEEVYYPTGGVQKYEYSTHKIIMDREGELEVLRKVGGLKVDRIRLYKDSLSMSSPETKTYVYSFDDNIGVGRLISNRGSEFNYAWKQNYMIGAVVNIITIGSSPGYSFDIPGGASSVEYNKVTEYQSDRFGHMINYKVSQFKNSSNPTRFYMYSGSFSLVGQYTDETDFRVDDLGFIYDNHDPNEINDKSGSLFHPIKAFYPIANRPVLEFESSYDRTGRLYHRVYREYMSHTNNNEHVVGFSVNDLVSADLDKTIPGATYSPAGRLHFPIKYNYFLYEIPLGNNKVSKEITTTFDNKSGNYIEQTTRFDYEPTYGFLRKTSTETSEGKTTSVENSYTFDYNTAIPVIDSLLNGHIIAKPILTQKIKDGKTVDANVNRPNGLGQLVSSYSFDNTVPLVQQNPSLLVPAAGFEKDFDLTYLNGRLVSSKKWGAATTSYLWSYDNQYPIAEIKNAGYGAVRDLLGELAIKNFSNKPYPSNTEVNDFLALLRNNLPHSTIKSSTYKPLIGMSGQTDEKNYVTSYDYNGFQQLRAIKDAQGDVVKSYDYNYTTKIGQVTGGEVPGTYGNVAKTVTFTKNNCSPGFYGTSVQYEVPGWRYSSNISQADADAKAQADIDEYGQAYANFTGECNEIGVYYNTARGQWIRRNSCASNMFGSEVHYYVKAKKYKSTISQADADAKAQNEIDLYGPGRANSKGICELKGIKLVRESYSSENIDVHIFEDFEVRDSAPFPLGYRNSITLVNFLPGTYKLVCQSATTKRFTINGISKIGTTVTFNNMELDDTNMVVTVTDL